jgi:pyruvate/2-oxoglutarate dehydrogenase complex dihydrolipoamide dehydrogenase (E3) component
MSNVVVVIGAGSIGQAIARRVSAGKHVVLADLRDENAAAAAEVMLDAGYHHVSTATVDVSSRGSVQELVETATSIGDVTGLIHAGGDVTGRAMVVHEAVREGLVAATNAVLDAAFPLPDQVSPMGSFTDPEYASVGMSEAAALQTHEVATATQPFGSMARPIIDGRETGFCKLVVDRMSPASASAKDRPISGTGCCRKRPVPLGLLGVSENWGPMT